MSSSRTLSRLSSEGERSSSSTISTTPSHQQQRLEAGPSLSDLESSSSFQRESHSVRYTSHVLDIHTEDNEEDDLSSIGSRRSINTAQWLMNEMHEDEDFDTPQELAGMTHLWKRQQSTGIVDQSVNLMDAKTAKYDERMPPPASSESPQIGLKKGPSFVFPMFGSARAQEKEGAIRKSKIKRGKKDTEGQVGGNGLKPSLKWDLLIILFLIVTFAVTILTIFLSHDSDGKTYSEPQDEVIFIAEQNSTGTQGQVSEVKVYHATSQDRGANSTNDTFAVFEETVDVSALKAMVTEEKNNAKSHTYEVTNEEVLFRPTLTLPAKTREQGLLAILLEFKLSNSNDLAQPNPKSAAYRAMKWMADDDPAQLTVPSLYYQAPHTAHMSRNGEEEAEEWRDDAFFIQQLLQRYVLAMFYFSLESSSEKMEELTTQDVVAAENHIRFRQSWLSSDHVCHWRGVDCGSSEHGIKFGVESVHLANIVSINLTRHNLVGSMPPEWFKGAALPELTTLDLSHNHLHGTLPEPMPVPTETGPFKVPSSQGEYSLRFPQNHTSLLSSFSTDSELLYLDIAHNHFTGTIPSLLQYIKHCNHLFLNHNQFSGPLGSLFSAGLGQAMLDQLDVGNNLLTGKVPNSLLQLSKLQLLSLESNFLSGTLPNIFEGLPDLVEVHMNDNVLEGSLPDSLGQANGVERISLEHNDLSGCIPSTWGTMTTLEMLSIHHNGLTGDIPTHVGSLPQLSDLSLQNNRLGGSIPSQLGLCTNLKRLYLEENSFHGNIPSSLGN